MVSEVIRFDSELVVKGKFVILKSMALRERFPRDPSHRLVFRITPEHASWLSQI